MNLSFRHCSLLLLALTCATLASGAAAAGASDTNPPISDVTGAVITGKIKAKLADDTMGTLVHISVHTDDRGGVELTGNAASQEDADRAVAAARGTEGVTGVNSDITIAN